MATPCIHVRTGERRRYGRAVVFRERHQAVKINMPISAQVDTNCTVSCMYSVVSVGVTPQRFVNIPWPIGTAEQGLIFVKNVQARTEAARPEGPRVEVGSQPPPTS